MQGWFAEQMSHLSLKASVCWVLAKLFLPMSPGSLQQCQYSETDVGGRHREWADTGARGEAGRTGGGWDCYWAAALFTQLRNEAPEKGCSYFSLEQGADINEQLINILECDGSSVSVPN